MKRQYDVAVDFSKGMNTQLGSKGDQDAPLFLQDVLLDRQPEVWRRGGIPFREPHFAAQGEVLAAKNYGYGSYSGQVLVVAHPDEEYTQLTLVQQGLSAIYLFSWGSGSHSGSTTTAATIASISLAWTYDEDEETSTPNRITVASDTGCYVVYAWPDDDPDDPPIVNVFKVVERGTTTPLAGDGYHHTEQVNGYNFLGNREGNSGVYTKRDFLAFSALEDSLSWEQSERKKSITTWAETGGYVQVPTGDDSNITALSSIDDKLLIFKRDSILAMQVVADPLQWSVKRVAELGTLDHRSIGRWKDGIVFANQTGVWYFNGYDMVSLSDDIQDDYEQALRSGSTGNEYYSNDWRLVGEVYGDYYFLFIRDGDEDCGEHIVSFMCYLPNKAWTTLSNAEFMEISKANRAGTALYAYRSTRTGVNNPGQMVRLDAMFDKPPGYNKSGNMNPINKPVRRVIDQGVTDAPKLKIKTRFRDMGAPNIRKTVREILVNYLLKTTNDNNNRKLSVKLQKGTQGQDYADYPESNSDINTLEKTSYFNQNRLPMVARDTSFSVEIEESGAGTADEVAINSIQLGYKPMRPSRNSSPLE